MSVREFFVATYCDPGEHRKTRVHAYTRIYNSAWRGFKGFTVAARNGSEAKRKAIELRLADEVSDAGGEPEGGEQ